VHYPVASHRQPAVERFAPPALPGTERLVDEILTLPISAGHTDAEIDTVARMAGVDRSDWSMALEPGSLAFFDGMLSGISNGRSYYLKEDLILELLSHLAQREPAFAKYLATENVLEDYGYPFGTRIDLATAAKSCRLLTAPGPQAGSTRRVGG